jgi:hypothetical protein
MGGYSGSEVFVEVRNAEFLTELASCFFFCDFFIFSLFFDLDISICNDLAGAIIFHEELEMLEPFLTVVVHFEDDMVFDFEDELAYELDEGLVKHSVCREHSTPASVKQNCPAKRFPDVGKTFWHCDQVADEIFEWLIEVHKF